MIEWLSEVFSSNSDKARLVTIVLSTVVGVSIFLLTQYFVRRKARREIMIEKIEAFYEAILEYEEHTYDAFTLCFDSTNDHQEKLKESLAGVIRALRKARTINQLYFSEIPFDREMFYSLTTSNMPLIQEGYKLSGFEGAEIEINNAVGKVSEEITNLETKVKTIMKRHRH